MYKILFMGTPQIAADILKTLLEAPDQWEVVGVVCQPDRALDRKKQPIFSPVKQLAMERNLPLFQSEKVNTIAEELNALGADLVVTCAFGQFVGQSILEHAKYGGVNLHASLLPKLRGGAPIHWAIINGEKETGVSLMKLAPKMDAGDYLVQRICAIQPTDTMATLYQKLAQIACGIVRTDLIRVFNPAEHWVAQDPNLVTFAPTIKKADTIINWDRPSQEIDHLIRGLNDKPLAIWMYDEVTPIKIWEAQITPRRSVQAGGFVTAISREGVEITTADWNMLITKLQLPNKRPMPVSEMVNGNHPIKINK